MYLNKSITLDTSRQNQGYDDHIKKNDPSVVNLISNTLIKIKTSLQRRVMIDVFNGS